MHGVCFEFGEMDHGQVLVAFGDGFAKKLKLKYE